MLSLQMPNNARHGDGFSVTASFPLQSRACWRRLRFYMKSSQLKPLLLGNLKKLFEVDPSPNAWGEVDSFASNIHGVTKDQVIRMIEHLVHQGLVGLMKRDGGSYISITDKGMEWLQNHDESRKRKSFTSWLIKPVAVAFATALFTVPVTIYITDAFSREDCAKQHVGTNDKGRP
jgi:ABC-type maltose transport system permease subunit